MDIEFLKEAFSQLDIRLIIGAVAGIIVFAIEVILTNKKIIGQKEIKRIGMIYH